MMKRPEESLARACAVFLSHQESLGRLTFAHIPNGGKRGRVEAAIFKAMGVRAGFPDYIILWKPRCAGFVELKSAEGRLSVSQRFWRDLLDTFGFPWAEVRSLDELVVILRNWGAL